MNFDKKNKKDKDKEKKTNDKKNTTPKFKDEYSDSEEISSDDEDNKIEENVKVTANKRNDDKLSKKRGKQKKSDDEIEKMEDVENKRNFKNKQKTKIRDQEEHDTDGESLDMVTTANRAENIKEKREDGKVNQASISNPTIKLLENQIIKTTQVISSKELLASRDGVFTPDFVSASGNGGHSGIKVLSNVIPSFFDVKTVTSGSTTDSFITGLDNIKNTTYFPLWNKAKSTWPTGTLTSRFVPKKNEMLDLPDPRNPSIDDTVKSVSILGSEEQVETLVARQVGMLCDALIAINTWKDVVVATPSKTTYEGTYVPADLRSLLDMKPAPCDNPNPAYLSFDPENQWLADEIKELRRNQGDVNLQEIEVQVSQQGIKERALWGLTTDQFAATILNNNAIKAENNAMIVQEIVDLMRAIVMKDYTEIVSYEAPNKRVVRSPRPEEEDINAFWTMMNVSSNMKLEAIELLTKSLASTNMVELSPIDTVLQGLPDPTQAVDVAVLNKITADLAAGKDSDFERLIVLDAFAGQVDISLDLTPSSNDGGNLIILAEALSFFVAFKGIASQNYQELGYVITTCLRNMFRETFGAWEQVNGWYKELNENGVWEVLMRNKTMHVTRITTDRIRPSIFCPAVPNPPGVQHLQQLQRLIDRIRNLCNTAFFPIYLDQKVQANILPFSHDINQALISHRIMTADEVKRGEVSDAYDQVNNMITILSDARKLMKSIQNNRYIEISAESWWEYFYIVLNNARDRSSILLNFTMGKMQEWIVNSPFYVSEMKRFPENGNFFLSPHPIAFRGEPAVRQGPNGRNNIAQARPVAINKPAVRVDFAMALRVLLTGEGEISNSINGVEVIGANKRDALTIESRVKRIVTLDPQVILNKFYDFMSYSKSGAHALFLIYCLSHPEAPDNFIRQIAVNLAPYLRVSTWERLIAKLVDLTKGYSAQEILQMIQQNGVVDGRYLRPTIVFTQKENIMVELPAIDNSRFYRDMRLIPQSEFANIMLIMNLYTDLGSPLKLVSTGLFIGQVFVENRTPRINEADILLRYPNQFNLNEITYGEEEDEQGRYFSVTIPRVGDIRTPLDERLRGSCVTIESMTAIVNNNLKRFLIQAINAGLMSMKLPNKEVHYDFIDIGDKTTLVDDQIELITINKLFNSSDHEAFYRQFPTTQYANNLRRDEYSVNGYIQWVGLLNDPKDTLVTSSLISTYQAPNNHTPFNWNNWKFGQIAGAGTEMEIDGVPKLNLPYPNMNNIVITWTRELYETKVDIRERTLNQFLVREQL